MTTFHDQIKKTGESINLSQSERAKMRSILTNYMGMKPIRNETYSVSISYRWLAIAHRPVAAALVLVMIFGSSVSYAAENSLPGDALYSVKTYVNEPARVALATNAEAKAEVQIELAERRIEEAAILAAEGRLDDDTENELTSRFETHAAAAAEHMEAADDEDDGASIELASRFETRLAAHEEILMEVENSDDREHSPRLAEAIRMASVNAVNIRAGAALALASDVAPEIASEFAADMSATSDAAIAPDTASGSEPTVAPMAMTMAIATDLPATATEPEPEANARSAKIASQINSEFVPAPAPDAKKISRMKTGAEKALKNAQTTLRKQKSLSAEARAQADVDIARAEDLIDDGDNFLTEDMDADAYVSFQESLRLSESTSVYIKAAPTLEKVRSRAKNVRTNVENQINDRVEVNVSAPAIDADASVTLPLPIEPVQKENSVQTEEEDGPEDESDDRSEFNNDRKLEERAGFNLLQKFNISL